jgi:hypothetical protein
MFLNQRRFACICVARRTSDAGLAPRGTRLLWQEAILRRAAWSFYGYIRRLINQRAASVAVRLVKLDLVKRRRRKQEDDNNNYNNYINRMIDSRRARVATWRVAVSKQPC